MPVGWSHYLRERRQDVYRGKRYRPNRYERGPCEGRFILRHHHVTGESGKYLGARGLFRETVKFDDSKNYNEAHEEGEYRIEK
jgi:hypothetical protein